MTQRKGWKKGNKSGPHSPTKWNADVIQKLKAAFSIYANISEACFHAGITTQTFYNNAPVDGDVYNELLAFRFTPKLKAKQTVSQKLGEIEVAWKFLKNTSPHEFAEKVIQENQDKAPDVLDDQEEKALIRVLPNEKQ